MCQSYDSPFVVTTNNLRQALPFTPEAEQMLVVVLLKITGLPYLLRSYFRIPNGGPRAGEFVGGWVGSPIYPRIFCIVLASVTKAMICISA